MNTLGRPVEALRLYNSVLQETPKFAMAVANRGLARATFAKMLHDEGHRAILTAYGWQDFEQVVNGNVFWEADYPDMINFVNQYALQIQNALDVEATIKSVKLDNWPMGGGKELAYRTTVLNMGLFLNPLAMLGPYSIAACDPLHLPSHSYRIEDQPHYLAWYNQLKQEFCAARLFYFESINEFPFEDIEIHFADRENFLVDTLDYPVFSIGAEKMRLSFRLAYGLLDKIAGFLNVYFNLGHDTKRVDLRGVWYTDIKKRNTLHSLLVDKPNLALRGLYWLSFDIVGEQGKNDDAIAPDAARLNAIRNVLEHRCLVLNASGPDETGGIIEKQSVTSFRRNTICMLEMAHEALILLSLAMHEEERTRKRPEDTIVVEDFLPVYRHK
jgi:hypothetical protein